MSISVHTYMHVVARIVTVPGGDMHDRAQDTAVCFSCYERVPVCKMYYHSEFEWKLVRCLRHLWNSVPCLFS